MRLHKILKKIAILTLLMWALAGCATPRPAPVTLTPSPTPSATITASPSIIPARILSLTPNATTTTLPPLSELTTRKPSVDELHRYLINYNSDNYYRVQLEENDWLYEDVSGDGEADLIIENVAVMVWMGDRYSKPYEIISYGGRYYSANRTYLQDWTGDNVPEINFEEWGDIGGTGYVTGGWGRSIIHCRADGCAEVWSGSIGGWTTDSNNGGIARTDVHIEPVIQEDGTALLKQYVESFVLFCCWDWEDSGFLDGLKIVASSVETYLWTGSTFELQSKEIVEPEKKILPPAIAPAVNIFGAKASIASEYNRALGAYNNICQLHLDSAAVGEPFGCRNFVTIEWKDITGDGNIELVVIALSSFLAANYTDYFCYHQRLIAYQWSQAEGIGSEIANIIGCVVQSDLFGVRLQDLDGNGVQEIIAAGEVLTPQNGEWFEFNNQDDIYRWNGTKYEYSETVPREQP